MKQDFKQISRFWHLLALLPGSHANNKEFLKKYYVSKFSNGHTMSLKELIKDYPGGFKALLNHLEVIVKDDKEKALKKAKSGVLLRCQKLGIDTTNWGAVNTFLRSPKIAGKELYKMDIDELNNLIKKLESIYKKESAKWEYINRMTLLN